MPPEKVWVAFLSNVLSGESFQVCATREAAIRWLVQQIQMNEWRQFYDSLNEKEREGITPDMSGMTNEQILEAWVGSDMSPDPNEWGTEAYWMSVTEQEIIS